MKHFGLSAPIILACAMLANAAAASGDVSVQGTILLRDGQPWVAKGFSTVGRTAPAAATKPGDYAQARQEFGAEELRRAKELGADVIRFQVSQGGGNPQSSIYSEAYLKEVKDAVSMARSMGFSVIVCVNGARPGGLDERGMPNEKTVMAWKSYAPLFRNDRGVMYELFNEPQPDGPDAVQPHDWDNWKAGMQPVVDQVRKLGAKNVLLVDGLFWAQMLQDAPKLDDPLSQIVYAVHPYFAPQRLPDSEAAWFNMFGRFAQHHPVLASEWSTFSSGPKCNDDTPHFAASMLAYLQQQHIGLVVWGIDFPGRLFKQDGTLTSFDGFQCGPDTEFGPGELISKEFKGRSGL
jgi:endoglucanase